MKKVLIVLLTLLFLTSCAYNYNYLSNTKGYLTSFKNTTSTDSISKNVNSFALDVFSKLYKSDENIFISPASIYLALVMTYNGAANETALQMAKAMYAQNLSLDQFNKQCESLQYIMNGTKDSSFHVANSIWLRDSFESLVKTDFLKRNSDHFGAIISSLDFSNRDASKKINAWVSNNTNGKIENAVDDKIDPLTTMFLINTIYFNAKWKSDFTKLPKKENFYTPTEPKPVDMMSKTTDTGYFENDIMQSVRLCYKDKKTSMILLLPKNNLNEFIKSLKEKILNDYIKNLYESKNVQSVNIMMPKINLKFNNEKFEEILKQLGIINAFIKDKADFSSMAANATKMGLYIGGVKHKTYLLINEKGTEAAAATKIEMKVKTAMLSDKTFIVNRPFITAIVDDKTGTIIFLGSIVNP